MTRFGAHLFYLILVWRWLWWKFHWLDVLYYVYPPCCWWASLTYVMTVHIPLIFCMIIHDIYHSMLNRSVPIMCTDLKCIIVQNVPFSLVWCIFFGVPMLVFSYLCEIYTLLKILTRIKNLAQLVKIFFVPSIFLNM